MDGEPTSGDSECGIHTLAAAPPKPQVQSFSKRAARTPQHQMTSRAPHPQPARGDWKSKRIAA